MTDVFIEGLRADVTQGLSSLLTLALDDLKDFGARNTSFSKTIVLPGTARNNKLFGSIFDVTSGNPYTDTEPNININFNAAKKARCMIMQDSVQSFKGDMRMTGIVIDGGAIEYEVVVFGELYGLVTSIGRGRLQDLDFSAYDHIYNWSNISSSWANDNAGQGYYYPLIDYGGYSTDKQHWAVGTFRPALFAREYLIKIFAAAGYTYTCALWDTDRFKRLIIPHNQKVLTANQSQALRAQVTTPFAVNLFANVSVLDYDTLSLGSFTESGGTFTWAPANTTSFHVVFTLQVQFTETVTNDFSLYFRKNGVKIPGTEQTIFADGTGAIFDYTAGAGFDVTLTQNDTFDFVFESFFLPSFSFNVNTCNILLTTAVAQLVPLSLGDTVTLNDTIPQNILQKDFLSSIMKLFNLYIYEDPNIERHVNIAPYVDFYDGTSINWTQKVDRSKPIQLTPMSQLTARFYDFKFKDDSDYYNDLYKKRYNEGYGQYSFDSAFDFEDERLTVELAFSPTPLVGYSGEDKIFSSIMKIENLIESQVDSNIRLLQAKTVTGVTAWNVTGVVSGLTSYPYAGHYNDPDAPSNDIQFGVPKELFFTLVSGDVTVQQFNIYWSSYMAEITDKDSRLMRCKMRLTVADIATLDFGKLIWIDGALWRLNKISDYNLSSPDLCEVSLLKVIEREY